LKVSQPAGEAAKQAHEKPRRRLRGGLARQCASDKGLRLMADRARVERACQSHKTGSGQYRLGAHPAAFLAKARKHFDFVRFLRTKGGMPALAREHMPAAVRGQKGGHTEPRAWTEHDLDTFAHRHGLAQRPRLRRAEKRHGPRNRLEIVQHAQLQKSEALRKLAASQPPPRAIGKHHFLAANRAGDGQRGRARMRTGLLKIMRDSRIQPGDRIIVDDQHALERSGGIAQRKPALTAANISHKRGTHRGYPDYNQLLANGLPHRQAGIRIFPAIVAQ
jgi:hypothetical protein